MVKVQNDTFLIVFDDIVVNVLAGFLKKNIKVNDLNFIEEKYFVNDGE